MSYQIQVKGEWGGSIGSWRPAISGELNQTSASDESASTFTFEADAHAALESMADVEQSIGDGSVYVLADDIPYTGQWRHGAPSLRIVEVAS